MELRFEDWRQRVDAWVGQLCGLSLDDLPDVALRDWFEDDVPAKVAARRAVRIMSGDADALERLAQEIDGLEARQARMKAINAAHKAFLKKPAGLDMNVNLTESDKAMVRNYQPAYSWEPHPFAPYQLTNNSANIRRIKARMEHIGRNQARPVEQVNGSAAEYEDDPPANRVRLTFPGKPSYEIRSELKKNGFRWTPSLGVWQAYRNSWSVATARKIAGLTEAA